MKYYIPAIIWAASIFWFSVTSGANFPEAILDFLSFDKIGHSVAYAGQAGLLFWAIYKSSDQLNSRQMVFVSFIVAFYGFSLEIIQYCFFPGRYFEVLDILANIMGIVIMHLIFKQFLNKNTAA